jgi:Nuclear pore assembly and biogenesis
MSSVPNPVDFLTTALLLLASLFIFFRIANYVRRLVMWWVFFLFKVALLYGVAVVAWSVWTRGVEVTLRDVAAVWGFVEGLVRRQLGEQQQQRKFGLGSGPGSGYGYGYGYQGGREQVPMPTRKRGSWV